MIDPRVSLLLCIRFDLVKLLTVNNVPQSLYKINDYIWCDCNNDCEPQGLIPTPEEEEELRLMNEPLFNSIPGVFDFETNETNGAVSSHLNDSIAIIFI